MTASKLVTTTLRHYDLDERQRDGSRHRGTIESVLMKASANYGVRDFDDGDWLRLIHDDGTNE